MAFTEALRSDGSLLHPRFNQLSHLGKAARLGELDGGFAIDVLSVRVGVVVQKQLYYVGVPFGGGEHKGGPAFVVVNAVDVGSPSQQQGYKLRVGTCTGEHERGAIGRVL